MPVSMDCFGLTDTGRKREVNEDQFLIADLNKSMLVRQTSLSVDDHTRLFGGLDGKLLIVADGMGGTAGGRKASGVAVHTLTRYVLDTMPWFLRLRGEEHDQEEELKAALEACQHAVEDAAAADPARYRMGTTLTLAYVLWPRLYVVHAGDSRCYLRRGGRLHRITRDHTIAQQLVERGDMSAQEAEDSRWSHVLWNCIGGGARQLNPDVYKAALQPGDELLLCTDGVSKHMAEDRIAATLAAARSAEEAARALVEAANDDGGSDNITAVVARFPATSQPARRESEPILLQPAQPAPGG